MGGSNRQGRQAERVASDVLRTEVSPPKCLRGAIDGEPIIPKRSGGEARSVDRDGATNVSTLCYNFAAHL